MQKRKLISLLTSAFTFIAFLISSHAEGVTGLDLILSQGCKGCHIINADGGKLGPSLDGVGKRLNGKQILYKLINPKKNHTSSVMPAFAHLTKQELTLLIDYLTALR